MTYSIAGRIIDFTDDPACMQHAEFLALAGDVLAKHASGSLSGSEYAVVLRGKSISRRYPIFDKIATVLSAHYFQEHADTLHPRIREVAAVHLKKACQEFKVAVPAKVAAYAKTARNVINNSVLLDELDPIPQPLAISKSARFQQMINFWEDKFRLMHPAERSEKAAMLFEAAGKQASLLPESARDYVPKERIGELFAPTVRARISIAQSRGDKTASTEYSELLTMVDPAKPKEAAEMLSTMDRKHNMAHMYGNISDPYQAVYGRLLKIADDDNDDDKKENELGLNYKLLTLAAESPDNIHSVLSASGLDALRRDPVGTFKRLPKPVQEFLLAEFDAHLRRNQDMPVSSRVSKETVEAMTKKLRSGAYEYAYPEPPLHPEKHHYPVSTYEPISKD